MRYSVIVPVYNRPQEIKELLLSLTEQSFKSFEVIIVEDGSDLRCREIVEGFGNILQIRYFEIENRGQGFARNFGFMNALGDYFVVFDSDCLVPPSYFEAVNRKMETRKIDCWGGPDRAHRSFTPIQKAINYSMTSLFTTGGIRGKSEKLDKFYPRSFNMGISREVFDKTNGYKITRMGEDLEFSIRIQKAGFETILIEEAFVYHKRRTNFIQFYRQLTFFGRARINVARFHPEQIKLLHIFPLIFTIGFVISITGFLFSFPLIKYLINFYVIYGVILAIDAFRTEKSIKIAIYSVLSGFIQLTGYGVGFAKELLRLKSQN